MINIYLNLVLLLILNLLFNDIFGIFEYLFFDFDTGLISVLFDFFQVCFLSSIELLWITPHLNVPFVIWIAIPLFIFSWSFLIILLF